MKFLDETIMDNPELLELCTKFETSETQELERQLIEFAKKTPVPAIVLGHFADMIHHGDKG